MGFIMEIKEIEAAVEGILFASGEPVSLDRLSMTLEVEPETLERIIEGLADHYKFDRRGVRVVRLEDSYQMTSAGEYSEWIRKALELRKLPQLSKAALEVLAITAYYQPVTRAYIEQIRGVDSSYTVGLLAERGLVEDCGFLDVPGRPRLFRTTKTFLRTFGISAVDELPQIDQLGAGLPEGQLSFDESLINIELSPEDDSEDGGAYGREIPFRQETPPEDGEGAVSLFDGGGGE
jgi:segregation and condensation protein B